MNDIKIITEARKLCQEKFSELAKKTNEDIGNMMITFLHDTTATRKVNDWGRDEDDDWFLGINEDGWIMYTHTIQYLAGPASIIESDVKLLNDEYILEYIKSSECSSEDNLKFMEKCTSIINRYNV